jgi:hypothetical protein
MRMNGLLIHQDEHNSHLYMDIKKGKLDLIILQYMARRLHLSLHQLDKPASPSQPLLYTLQERHERTHRIAIYRYHELFLRRMFTFVGFISRKHSYLPESIVAEIQQADQQLIAELVGNPGILSYSSLELRNGDWCNLVLLSNARAKAHIKSTKTHAYAAHHLAYRYYEWIRLHNGIMPQGLDHTEMLLLKTKQYSFQVTQPRPAIRELIYSLPC